MPGYASSPRLQIPSHNLAILAVPSQLFFQGSSRSSTNHSTPKFSINIPSSVPQPTSIAAINKCAKHVPSHAAKAYPLLFSWLLPSPAPRPSPLQGSQSTQLLEMQLCTMSASPRANTHPSSSIKIKSGSLARSFLLSSFFFWGVVPASSPDRVDVTCLLTRALGNHGGVTVAPNLELPSNNV